FEFCVFLIFFFFSSRRRHTRFSRDWSSDVCSSDLVFSSGFIIGENWVEVGDDEKEGVQKTVEETTEEYIEEEINLEQMTKSQLKIGRASCRKECRSRRSP